jgi:very-short-patch-repair endonuclease
MSKHPRVQCEQCDRNYDCREDNIGLRKGICKKCNIRNMKVPLNITFEDKCRKCETLYDSREDNIGLEKGICRECNIGNLIDTGCRVRGKLICNNIKCARCFGKSFASNERAKFWHPNNNITPRNIMSGSQRKFWFICGECRHEFDTNIYSVTSGGYWCRFCAGLSRCQNQECKPCFERSFASNKKALDWHSTKNENNTPRTVSLNDHQKYWFNCGKCKHDFDISLNKVNSGRWCRYCANQARCDDEKCQFCFKHSFASHKKAQFWHPTKNKISPRSVALKDDKKYWFICQKCEHDFDISPSSIDRNNWCSFCSNKRRCNNQNCQFCFDNSFASSEKAQFWHPTKNENSPRDVALCDNDKYWFICERHHEFKMGLNKISSEGNWCRFCKNKTEAKLLNTLKKHFDKIIHQFKPEWCRNLQTKKYMPFDLCIAPYNIIIEVDGRQHFEDAKCWRSLAKDAIDRDKRKMDMAIQNGYSIIRIYQVDVWSDTYDWESDILQAIEICKNSPQIKFCSKNAEQYNSHK